MINQPSLEVNKHLNLFRFFNESDDKVYLENNLSRAFVQVLKNEALILNEYIRKVVSPDDYEYLFLVAGQDATINLYIQINTQQLIGQDFKKVYAIAMATENLDLSDFEACTKKEQSRHITDIVISIKDIGFVIEVKRTGEDCKKQLFNQVRQFIESENKTPVIATSVCWPDVIAMMERCANIQKLSGFRTPFLQDFIDLAEERYVDWFPSRPFHVLAFSEECSSPAHKHLMKRLKHGLGTSSFPLLHYNDRIGISVPFGWASEIIPGPESDKNTMEKFIAFYIWPGNTKGQGYSIFHKPLAWVKQKTLSVEGKEYELDISYNVKFCHFNRYISQLNFYPEDLKDPASPIHSKSNFDNYSGKWESTDWKELEIFLDNHLKKEYNWQSHCAWEESFLNTDRSYCTISFGFEVALYIPYAEFQELDRKPVDMAKIGKKVDAIAQSFRNLI